jgi:hypothetical protein
MKEKKHNKMCGPTVGERDANNTTMEASKASSKAAKSDAPVERLLDPPSLAARYACAGLMVAVFGVWGKFSFVEEASAPCIGTPLHSYMVPLVLTSCYILSLPLLRIFSSQYLAKNVDVKLLLKETMVVYNAGQVALNAWMVYRYIDAVVFREHPFIGDIYTVNTGATYAVWIHYCDKYLEFFDTFFMVLRGRMDQVRSFRFSVIDRLHAFLLYINGPLNTLLCFHSSGFLPSRLPPHFHHMGVVDWLVYLAGWRLVFWRPFEFLDSCHDVFLLHFESVEDQLPVEEVPDAGSVATVHLGRYLFHLQRQETL